MTVATYADVEVSLGRSISIQSERLQVEWWLQGIEHIIAGRLGDVSALDQDVLKYVEVEAAVAKVNRNGRGESSVTVSVDDGTVTRRYENQVSAGDITDAWWHLLDSDSNTGTASIRPSFEADTAQWAVSTPPLADSSSDPYWRSFP